MFFLKAVDARADTWWSAEHLSRTRTPVPQPGLMLTLLARRKVLDGAVERVQCPHHKGAEGEGQGEDEEEDESASRVDEYSV